MAKMRNAGSKFKADFNYRLTNMTYNMAEILAKDLKATGYEVSRHPGHRPSHTLGGRQYTFEEMERLGVNAMLQDFNCRHRKYPVKVGVTKPRISERELARLEAAEGVKHEWNGREYTLYELKQIGNRYKRDMKKLERGLIVAEGLGKGVAEARAKLEKKAATHRELMDRAEMAMLNGFASAGLVPELLDADGGAKGVDLSVPWWPRGSDSDRLIEALERVVAEQRTAIPQVLSLDEISVNSETYTIMHSLQERFVNAPVGSSERQRLMQIGEDARRLYEAGTPYIYAQDKIMNELRANAEMALAEIARYYRMAEHPFINTPPRTIYLGSWLTLAAYDPNKWDYKLQSAWQVPYDYFDGLDMNVDNNRNWRPFMYFDGDIISADYFGNLNLGYIGTIMGLQEWVWNNFTTRDTELDIRAMEHGREIALREMEEQEQE